MATASKSQLPWVVVASVRLWEEWRWIVREVLLANPAWPAKVGWPVASRSQVSTSESAALVHRPSAYEARSAGASW